MHQEVENDKQVVGACVLAWSSNQWLWELRVAFSNLHPIEPPRLSFTNPPPLVLLPIARLGHTQGSMGCQTPHCIPLQHSTPRWPQSKRMAHRRGEHHTSQGCTVYYLTVSQPGLNIINNILSKKTIGLSDSKRFFCIFDVYVQWHRPPELFSVHTCSMLTC